MKQRRTIYVVVLGLLACLLCLACLACAGAAWWAMRSGRLDLGRLPGQTRVRAGGELRLWGDEPVTLDPALVQDAYSAAYVVEIFSGLVTLDQNLEVAPDLAERWQVSNDGRTYTFYLRRDARFQDGKPVTADDVRYSLERACSPELASPSAPSYLGDIEGAHALMEGRASKLSGVRVVDERTLAITMDAPKVYFLAKLACPTAFVVDRANVSQGSNWTERPNGTGPFRLAQRDGQRIVLERNEHYYRELARLERVTFVLAGGSPLTMYENGELDIAEAGLADLERVQDPANPLSRELAVVGRMDVQYLGMNVRQPPFDDLKVRQAIAHAIDRQRLADVVWQRRMVAARGILPPGMPGYRPELQGLAYDPELARRKLGESRYKTRADVPTIVLHTSGTGGSMPPTISAIVAMLESNLGLEVEVQQTPWQQFLVDLNERRYGFFSSGWIADYADPENFLDILFHSRSSDNHMAYANAEVDRLLERARVEADRDRRLALYQQAEDIILQEAAWVPLWHGRDFVLTKPYVKGAVYSGAIRPWLKDVYIER